jgi:hypothetical protein
MRRVARPIASLCLLLACCGRISEALGACCSRCQGPGHIPFRIDPLFAPLAFVADAPEPPCPVVSCDPRVSFGGLRPLCPSSHQCPLPNTPECSTGSSGVPAGMHDSGARLIHAALLTSLFVWRQEIAVAPAPCSTSQDGWKAPSEPAVWALSSSNAASTLYLLVACPCFHLTWATFQILHVQRLAPTNISACMTSVGLTWRCSSQPFRSEPLARAGRPSMPRAGAQSMTKVCLLHVHIQ